MRPTPGAKCALALIGLALERPMKKTNRLLALGLATPLLALMTLSSQATENHGRPLSDSELSAVQAAGLTDPALRNIVLGSADAASTQTSWLDAPAHFDRQQALAQYKFAALTAQGSVGLVQTASLATVSLPLAAVFLPMLALPFPFLMQLPPKKAEPGH